MHSELERARPESGLRDTRASTACRNHVSGREAICDGNRNERRSATRLLAKGAFFPLACALVLPTAAVAQLDGVRSHIIQILQSEDVPSIAVAVAKNGEILWEEGFGWANQANGVRASAHVMYPLASVTKPLTATGLMVLSHRGLIDLDRPVNEYLGTPALEARVGDAAGITARRLANHTAGLPDHIQLFYEDEPVRAPPTDALIRDYGFTANLRGSRPWYSNLNFGVLGHLISRVANVGFADFMREEVFLPLGMTHTAIGARPGMDSIRAVRYVRGGPWPDYETDTPGATDGYSSAHDLLSFVLYHMKRPGANQSAILSDEAIDLMQRPTGEAYGVSWEVERVAKGRLRVGHNGGLPGVTTRLAMYPEEDLAVVVLANVNTNLLEVERMIVDALLTGDPPETPDDLREEPTPEEPARAAPVPEVPDERLVGAWRGHVEVRDTSWPIRLDIRADGEVRLLIQEPATRYMGGEMWTLLNRVSFGDGRRLWGFALPGNWTSVPHRKAFFRRLDLTLGADVLYGWLSLYESSVHTSRSDTLLSYWVTLAREE